MGALIDEFKKTPDQLSSENLEKATKIADIITRFRKFLYFFFSIGSAVSFLAVCALLGTGEIYFILIGLLLIPYTLFKVRDYIRGTI